MQSKQQKPDIFWCLGGGKPKVHKETSLEQSTNKLHAHNPRTIDK